MNTAKYMLTIEKNPTTEIATYAEFKAQNVRPFLNHVSSFYPGFQTWFNFKFLSGLNSGERKVLIVKEKGEIAGISLLKVTKEENKICTFFVAPEYRGKGIGTMLMESSLANFDGSLHITVCEERNADLKPFLQKNGFRLDSEQLGLYRDDVIEYFYTR